MYRQFLLLVLLLVKTKFSSAVPLVEIPNGQIQGVEGRTIANTTYYAFLKIPYATPPIGDLRFKAPQPAQDWDGILNATYLDVSCFQIGVASTTDSEDCLHINVFTPQLPDSEDYEPLAVMFFIYGGSFIAGSTLLYPPDLFVDNGVILVTINYRLGPFGFLSTQDDVIPGNNGLKDQRLAIQWTHDNIGAFGGDPEKITIFGESAGSASVGYQLLNHDNNGLFRGAILESGSFLSPWAYQRDARRVAFGTASVLDSTFQTKDNSQELLDFLKGVPGEVLNAAALQYLLMMSTPMDYSLPKGLIFAPVIEAKNPDAFITNKMYGLLQAGNILPVPTLLGFNSEETLYFNPDPVAYQAVLEAIDAQIELVVPDDMLIVDEDQRTETGRTIRDFYTDGKPFAENPGDGIRCSSDNFYNRPIRKHAELFSKIADTFFYQFSYDGLPGGVTVHYDGAENVGHTEELYYLFCWVGCDLSNYPMSDQITQKRLITLWTNFAKYQNPTPEPSDLMQNITWPPVSTEGGDFLYLDINEDLEIRNHPKNATYQKWIDLYDSLGYDDFDTY